jgi:hypothetical protein
VGYGDGDLILWEWEGYEVIELTPCFESGGRHCGGVGEVER